MAVAVYRPAVHFCKGKEVAVIKSSDEDSSGEERSDDEWVDFDEVERERPRSRKRQKTSETAQLGLAPNAWKKLRGSK